MILKAALDKVRGKTTQYQKIPEHECFISVSDAAISAPWSHVENTIFTVPFHQMTADEAREFIKKRFAALTQDGCVMVPYTESVGDQVYFGLIYYPGRTYMSFDHTINRAIPDEPDALAEYLVDMMLVGEIMDN